MGVCQVKVAVCFSGHLRTFEKTFESVQKNIFDLYDCDTFIHTWEALGPDRRPEDEGGQKSVYDVSDIVQKAYSPRAIVIEKQKEFHVLPHQCFQSARTPPVGVFSKWYSSYEVNKLRRKYEQETGTLYDAVISIRPDLLFLKPLQITIKDNNSLYVPGNIRVPEDSYVDYIAYGFPPIMDTYFQTSKHFDLVCSKLQKFRPEYVLSKYLQLQNVKIDTFNVYYSIVRLSGEVYEMGYL